MSVLLKAPTLPLAVHLDMPRSMNKVEPALSARRRVRSVGSVSETDVSANVPDWTREECPAWAWNPAKQLLRAIRDYQNAIARGGATATLLSKEAVARHRFWSIVTGADIPLNSRIEGGLMLPHPQGVVVHPNAHIGVNCCIFQQVTIGTGPRPGVPTIGGHVDLGPGCKVLGGVTIGNHAVIGANAVVIADVPPGGVAMGIPAQIKSVRRIVD